MSRSELAIFTNMCWVENQLDQVLVQDRQKKDWPGVTFPGGHVEKEESFHQSVIREIQEETGLTIQHPVLCGVKQFQTNMKERYVVLCYKAKTFSGELRGSKEGEVFWVDPAKLSKYPLARDFDKMLPLFLDETVSEFFYEKQADQVIDRLY